MVLRGMVTEARVVESEVSDGGWIVGWSYGLVAQFAVAIVSKILPMPELRMYRYR